MKRAIKSFQKNRFQEWDALLVCGHSVTMRHNPPYMSCRWIGTAEGRQAHVGDDIDCVSCDMPTLPVDVTLVKVSGAIDVALNTHVSDLLEQPLEPNHWAVVEVLEGMLQFVIAPATEESRGFLIDPSFPGIAAPGVSHHLSAAMGSATVLVKFYLLNQ